MSKSTKMSSLTILIVLGLLNYTLSFLPTLPLHHVALKGDNMLGSMNSDNLESIFPEGCLPNGVDSVKWINLYNDKLSNDDDVIMPVFPLGGK